MREDVVIRMGVVLLGSQEDRVRGSERDHSIAPDMSDIILAVYSTSLGLKNPDSRYQSKRKQGSRVVTRKVGYLAVCSTDTTRSGWNHARVDTMTHLKRIHNGPGTTFRFYQRSFSGRARRRPSYAGHRRWPYRRLQSNREGSGSICDRELSTNSLQMHRPMSMTHNKSGSATWCFLHEG